MSPFCVLVHWEVLFLAKQAYCYCRMVHSWAAIKFSLKIFKLSCVPFIFIVVIQRILLTYLLNKWKLAVLESRILILLLTFPAFLQMCNSVMFQSLRSRLPPVTKLVTALPYLKAADKVKSQLWLWHLCYKIFTAQPRNYQSAHTTPDCPPSWCLHGWNPPRAWKLMSGRLLLAVCKKWYPPAPLSHTVTDAHHITSAPFQIFCSQKLLLWKISSECFKTV